MNLFFHRLDEANWDDIIKSCDTHTKFRHDVAMVEDLMLTCNAVLNSVEDEKLLCSITSLLSQYEYINQMGPLALWILLNEIA